MKKLVRFWKRPCKNGQAFKYVLIWYDELGKERWQTLGHTDGQKAQKQRVQKERELRMGLIEPETMKLSQFQQDCLVKTNGQVREGTLDEYGATMDQFIEMVGDVDYRSIRHEHGERFIQTCLKRGNSPATANKKIGSLKRIFQMAVQRRQLEDNPFRYVRKLKVTPRKIRVFTDKECQRMIQATQRLYFYMPLRWDILILTALGTGMRRGELLNTTWQDIDFEKQLIHISPKENTKLTWPWQIKDTDRRSLPLTKEVMKLLREHQDTLPEDYPYVFVPPARHARIQKLRQQGRWTARQCTCPVGNIREQFISIREKARIDHGTFHDLRRTCLTNWLAQGLSEYEVMILAGHASFDTTHKFYLAVRDDIMDRARQASTQVMERISIANQLQAVFVSPKEKFCPS